MSHFPEQPFSEFEEVSFHSVSFTGVGCLETETIRLIGRS